MSSALAEQLQQIAVAAGIAPVNNRIRGKASLLYTFQEAADIDTESIYEIGLQGFEQLCRLDVRFQTFSKSLFGHGTLSLDRSKLTMDENKQLDNIITAFCRHLCAFFTLPPAFKALEYLIRKFRVHERNIPALMTAALPYHATNEFVRLVQVMLLDKSLFTFLEPMQSSGVPPPRFSLVARCINDRPLLKFILDTTKTMAEAKIAGRVVIPFYAATVCEVLAGLKAIDEPLVATMLPYLRSGLSNSSTGDFRAATYMVISQLATKATLGAVLVEAIVVDMCGSASVASLPQLMLVLCHMAYTQGDHFKTFPNAGFMSLAKIPGLSTTLASILQGKKVMTGPLMHLLLSAAVRQTAKRPAAYGQLLRSFVHQLPLETSQATELAKQVLQSGSDMVTSTSTHDIAAEENEAQDALLSVLKELDLRHPAAVDAAVNAAMQASRSAEGASADQHAARLIQFLDLAFAGTARSPLEEAGTTINLAVDAPSAEIRLLALQRLGALAAAAAAVSGGGGKDADLDEFLQGALLRRLLDDDAAVVHAALDLTSSLVKLPSDALVDSLSKALQLALQAACGTTSQSSTKAERASARTTARKVLHVISGPFLDQYPEQSGDIVPLILACLLLDASAWRVQQTAIKAAKKLDKDPLLSALSNIAVVIEEEDAVQEEGLASTPSTVGKKAPHKGGKKAAAAAAAAVEEDKKVVNKLEVYETTTKSIIEALSTKVVKDKAACSALEKLIASGTPHGRLLLLTVAHHCLSSEATATSKAPPTSLNWTLMSHLALKKSKSNNKVELTPMEALVLGAAIQSLPDDEQLKKLFKQQDDAFLELFKALWQVDRLTDERHQMQSLINRAAAASASPAILLSSICGRPVEDEAVESGVQAAAAHIWAQCLKQSNTAAAAATAGNGTAKTPKKKAPKNNGAVVGGELESLPRLLCTLSHPKKAVRSAALSSLDAFIQTIDSWWDASSIINGTGASTPTPTRKNNENVQQLSKDSCLALLTALKEQSTVILSDSESAEWMIQNTLNHSHSGIISSDSKNKKTTLNGSRKSPAGKNSTTTIPAASLALTDQQKSEITQWMLQQMPQQLTHTINSNTTSADINAAHFLLSCVSEAAQPGELLVNGVGLLNRLLNTTNVTTTSTKPVSLLESQLAVDLVHLYSPEALKELTSSNDGTNAAAEETLLNVLLLSSSTTAPADSLRAAAKHAALDRLFDTPLYTALQPERHVPLVMALLQVTSRDEDDGCRHKASEVLAAIPLPFNVLLPLLDIHQPTHNNMATRASPSPTSVTGKKTASNTGGSSAKKRSKKNGASSAAAGDVVVMSSDKVEEVLAVLELLQWKENIPDSIELVASLQSIALYLLDLLSAEADKQEEGGDGGRQGEEDDDGEVNPALPVAGYGLRLATSALDSLAHRHLSAAAAAAAQSKKGTKNSATTTMAPFNMSLAVRCAQEAPDSSTQTAALSLVSTLALSNPKDALHHVLDIVAVVGGSGGTGTGTKYDAHSSKIAGATLAAVVPAWLQSKWPVAQLASAVATASKEAPIDRRMALMQGLAHALPDNIGGLVAVVIALLKEASSDDSTDDDTDTDHDEEGGKSREVAAALIRKATAITQAKAFASLLEESTAGDDVEPTSAIARASVSFVSTCLRPSLRTIAVNEQQQQQGDGEKEGGDDMQSALQSIMHQAVAQLQRLGELAASYSNNIKKNGRAAKQQQNKKNTKAQQQVPSLDDIAVANVGVTALLKALQAAMAPSEYISALADLVATSGNDKVKRKGLTLANSCIKSLSEDGSKVVATTAADSNTKGAEEEKAMVEKEELADAAISVVIAAVDVLEEEDSSALTRQVALATMGTLCSRFAADQPEPFLEALSAVLDAAKDPRPAVCGSALAALAAAVHAMGARLVPLLPATVSTAVSTAQQAVSGLESKIDGNNSNKETTKATEEKAKGKKTKRRGAKQAEEEAEHQAEQLSSATKESLALELAAALATIEALSQVLAPFLASHLPHILTILLSPTVQACKSGGCSTLAAAIQSRLATLVPARLLLAPLLAHIDTAVVSGSSEAVCGLLNMVGTAVEGMSSADVATHHEALFAFLLKGLDLRRVLLSNGDNKSSSSSTYSTNDINTMEHSSVECMVKLTLRLSESKFRPLFLRLLEWSKVSPADEASLDEAAVYQRPLALFAVGNALVERLRSVFVPYFKYLLPHCLDALNEDEDGDRAADNEEPKKKKKKQQQQQQSKIAAEANDDKAVIGSKWLLRLRAIRALHRCFLYDSIGFLNTVQYDHIMPAVVQQLTASPPPSVFLSLRQDSQYTGMSEEAGLVYGESVLALPSTTTTGDNDGNSIISIDSDTPKGPLHVYQRAAVAAVAQLAVTAGSDSAWKSLNHAVCLATRTSLLDVGGRLTALCALHQLVEKLSEEYLVLLPETLPFLAELLEDAELVVEAAARDVVKRLEEVSGESLADYLK